MTLLNLFLIGHIVVFGVWFGTDIATFILSRRVLTPSIDLVVRRGLGAAMMSIEVIARLCLPSMLAFGLSLAIDEGLLEVSTAWIPVVWVFTVAWLALIWTVHTSDGESKMDSRLSLLDLGIRSVICVALYLAGIWSLVSGTGPFLRNSLSVKVVLFAVIMTCGIVIRFQLRPFSAAFAALVAKGSTPETESALSASLRRAQPLVGLIWVSLLASVMLGVTGMLPWE